MKNSFQIYLLLLMLCTLAGCATTQTVLPAHNDKLFADKQFKKPHNLPSVNTIFVLTDAQQDWLDNLLKHTRDTTLTNLVIDKVLKRDYRFFDYDNSYTRTAAQTLEMGQGNCLSMVIMTAAIAKHYSIPYKVHDIKTAPVWDRDGGLYLLNGHVNIQLKNGNANNDDIAYEFMASPYITLDFINTENRRHLTKRLITEQELIAMYFVNLAADAMVIKHWELAYWLLRQSISSDPYYSPAWNSLGVLYRYNQLPQLAERTYKYAMAIDTNNVNVISNYALLLESQGRYQELFDYQRKVDLAKLNNPYRYYDKGDLAFSQQNYQNALVFYNKAIKLSPFVEVFYVGLFRTHLALGNKKKAVRNLQLAQKNSLDYSDRQRYNAKLALLKSQR